MQRPPIHAYCYYIMLLRMVISSYAYFPNIPLSVRSMSPCTAIGSVEQESSGIVFSFIVKWAVVRFACLSTGSSIKEGLWNAEQEFMSIVRLCSNRTGILQLAFETAWCLKIIRLPFYSGQGTLLMWMISPRSKAPEVGQCLLRNALLMRIFI